MFYTIITRIGLDKYPKCVLPKGIKKNKLKIIIMKKIIILFVLLLMGCEKNPNNIEIKKEEFKSIIRAFYEREGASIGTSKNDTLSVAFVQEKNRIKVELYSFEKLDDFDEHCIGETEMDGFKIFFYAFPKKIDQLKDIIKIKYNKEYKSYPKSIEKDVDETYDYFYILKNGKIENKVYKDFKYG